MADFKPTGNRRTQGPDLADVYRRFRPDYLRDWIAYPKIFLPYTPMPDNISYRNPQPLLSELYHGTNVEQVQAVTDLLMNFDQYATQSTRIADRVKPAAQPGAEGAATSTSSSGGGAN
jgi:hypothetical protein